VGIGVSLEAASSAQAQCRWPDVKGAGSRRAAPIDEFVYFGHLGQDVYRKFLDALAPDYKPDTNLFVFSYDWRLSSFDNASVLKPRSNNMRNSFISEIRINSTSWLTAWVGWS